MILANGARPRAVLWRLLPILFGAGLLAGCQSASEVAPPAVQAADWRVVERSGEARYLAPGTSGWAPVMPAAALPGGSQVVTGDGGRLILARATDHVSAGPASRFNLPDATAGATLEQSAGRLRYRLGEASPLAVATPALAIHVQDSAFDVTVGGSATEVAVERGRVRVATPDGEREIELGAGQSAEAGSRRPLAFRTAGGQPLQPVERTILPALQPLRAIPAPPASQPLSALRRLPELQPAPGLAPGSTLADGAAPGAQLPAAGGAMEASTSAAASIELAVVVAPAGRAPTGSTDGAAAPGAGLAAPAPTEATSAPRGAAATEATSAPRGAAATDAAPAPTGALSAEAPSTPMGAAAPEATATPIGAASPQAPLAPMSGVAAEPGPQAVADDPVSAPVPADPPAAAPMPEDPHLAFDRLTQGMVDAVPADRTPRDPSTHARRI